MSLLFAHTGPEDVHIDTTPSSLPDVSDGLVLVDGSGRILAANAAFVGYANYVAHAVGRADTGSNEPFAAEPHEHALDGDLLTDVLDPATAMAVRRRLGLGAGNGGSEPDALLDFETYAPHPLDRWLRLRTHPQTGGDLLIQVEDVTARRRAEEQLNRDVRLTVAADLAGGVAHELNNLLTSIRGHADLLALSLEDDAAREDLSVIQTGARRAAAVAEHLLAFSGRQLLRPVPTSSTDLLAGLVARLENELDPGVTLDVEVPDHLPEVIADESQLRRLVDLLVALAVARLTPGDRVQISARQRQFDDDVPLALQPGRYVELIIHDDGHAVPNSVVSGTFATPNATGEMRHLALRMAAVHGIVAQSNGSMQLHVDTAGQTTLVLQLPATSSTDAGHNEPAVEPQPVAGTTDVIVVDDDPSVRRYATRVLRQHGFEVLPAADAASALALVDRGHPPRVLLTDVVMPGMPGDELAARVLERHPDVGVVLMASYSRVASIGPQRGTETATFLSKPFAPAALIDAVRAALTA